MAKKELGGLAATAGKAPAQSLRSLAAVVGCALGVCLALRAFVIEAYRVPTSSMAPTLLAGDWMLVSKTSSGRRWLRAASAWPLSGELKRGDVIVFVAPATAEPDGGSGRSRLVKRIVGMPGDTVLMRAGELLVNGVAMQWHEAANASVRSRRELPRIDPAFAAQSAYALSASRFGRVPAVPTEDEWGPLLVPSDSLFVVGDNRRWSRDSRYWGPVARAKVIGRPRFVYFSLDEAPPPNVATSFAALRPRWERVGLRVR